MRIILCILFFNCIIIFLPACNKKDNQPAETLAEVSINDVSVDRDTILGSCTFIVSLDKTSATEVRIHFATVAATAEENKDYIPVSKTINFPPGTQQLTIDVLITGDSIRKANQVLYAQLDSPENCKLSTHSKGTGTIVNENGLYFPVDNTGYTTPGTYPGYTLAWSDEFNDSSVNRANWSFEDGNNNGWGNNELEYYTSRPQNAFVSKGNLIIEARQENFAGSNYTSARMITKGNKAFTFGRTDIRAKLPKGKGIWPALWLLGSNIDIAGWPACGEIDMMELLGQEPNKMYGTLHWGADFASHASKGDNYILSSGSFDEEFHVYSMVWKEDSIKMYADDVAFFAAGKTDVAGDYPFNKDFFFIFNVAVGGSWPGNPDGTTGFPQRMVVDYIRVFQ